MERQEIGIKTTEYFIGIVIELSAQKNYYHSLAFITFLTDPFEKF